jgi:hypothetical protein
VSSATTEKLVSRSVVIHTLHAVRFQSHLVATHQHCPAAHYHEQVVLARSNQVPEVEFLTNSVFPTSSGESRPIVRGHTSIIDHTRAGICRRAEDCVLLDLNAVAPCPSVFAVHVVQCVSVGHWREAKLTAACPNTHGPTEQNRSSLSTMRFAQVPVLACLGSPCCAIDSLRAVIAVAASFPQALARLVLFRYASSSALDNVDVGCCLLVGLCAWSLLLLLRSRLLCLRLAS